MKQKFILFIVLLFCSLNYVMAQEITVSGQVKDQKGLPIPGVSVKVKGTNNGVATLENGSFILKAPTNSTLTFSFVGYKTVEENINNRTSINITLSDDNSQLNEVVVVGYGTQVKKDLTTAVVSISAKDIENQPVTNPLQAIQGKAAGVQITSQSGKPGSGVAITIRGNTSINASNSPLYVIDGVTSRDASFINPSDIETMTILKDASAAAIYGSSGANGVVLITTKRGSDKLRVSFNAFTGFSNLWQKQDVLNRDQYIALMSELGYGVSGLGNENTDWQDLTFGTGTQNNYQASISGGGNGGLYSFSTGYQQDKGIVAPAKLDKYTAHFNGSQSITKWLKLTASALLTQRNSIDVSDNNNVARGGTILSALTTPPTIGIYAANGTYAFNPYKGGSENPVANAMAAKNRNRNFRFLGSFAAEINFTKDFSFKSSISTNNNDNNYSYFLDPYSTDYGRAQKGIRNANFSTDHVWLNENILNYTKNWGKNAFTATGGMTLQESRYYYLGYNEQNFIDANTGALLDRGTSIPVQLPTIAEWAKRSYLARLTYSYDGKYLLSSNFRADGSSRFAPENRYGYFPSASIGWRISGENFMKNVKSINDLKLRASWGKVGNDEGIGDYSYLELYSPTTQGSYVFSQLANPTLSWEETTQTNVGLDLTMFNNRLVFTADAYIKKTDGLLIQQPIPNSTGFSTVTRNVGAMENKGLEFVLSTKNFVKDKFTWNTDINLTINRNKVTSLGNRVASINFGGIYERDDAIRVVTGRPLGSFYGYVSQGVDPQTGNIIYQDLNGGGISADDRTFIGSAQPDFTYGVNNTFTFGNIGLNFLFQGVQGNQMFNASRMELEGMNDSKNQSTVVLNRWTTPGQITSIPKAIKDNSSNTLTSSRFVEDGSYLRLKTTTLSYSFGKMSLGKLKMSKLMLYATGYNLLTFTKYTGFDPEVNVNAANGPAMGIDYGTYPQARTFLFGVNVGF